jgi:hypothetical protein
MRIRREPAGMSCRPASTDKAARLRKYNDGRLRVDDELGGLNVGDRLWRRIITLNYLRFLSDLRVGWGNGCVRRTGADRTSRSNLLVV